MSTTTSLTCQLECDERTVNVINTSTGATVVNVQWPAEAYAELEPDYVALSATVTEMLESTLGEAGYEVDGEPYHPAGSLLRAVSQAVTPGAPFTPRTFMLNQLDVNYTPGDYPADRVDVPVKHGSMKYVDRDLTVEIMDTGVDGNRETDVPSISLMEYGRYQVLLTWQEAEALAAALTRITGVARNG